MAFDIKKFLGGFNIFNGEKFGKLAFYAILIAIGLAIYSWIMRPTNTIIAKPGANLTVIQNQAKDKHWAIGGNAQSDKTIGISVMYLF